MHSVVTMSGDSVRSRLTYNALEWFSLRNPADKLDALGHRLEV